MTDSLLAEELGHTQTVKDARAAYERIVEAKRQYAVRMRNARQDRQKYQAEMETFLDDLHHITGLPFDSLLFMQIACMTIDQRLTRRKQADAFTSSLEDGWPEGF
jgi:hypothetical protein